MRAPAVPFARSIRPEGNDETRQVPNDSATCPKLTQSVSYATMQISVVYPLPYRKDSGDVARENYF